MGSSLGPGFVLCLPRPQLHNVNAEPQAVPALSLPSQGVLLIHDSLKGAPGSHWHLRFLTRKMLNSAGFEHLLTLFLLFGILEHPEHIET